MKNLIYKESISHFLDSGLSASSSNNRKKSVLDDGNNNDDISTTSVHNMNENRIDVASVRLLVPTGSPQLILSDGRTFYFSLEMRVWVNMPQNTATSTASLLDSLVSSSYSSSYSSSSSCSSLTNRVLAAKAVSELEDAICAFKVTRRHVELRKAIKLYALKLTACETPECVRKIEELCEELVRGGDGFDEQGSGREVGGGAGLMLLPGRELLKELLPIFSTNRSLQRLVSTYNVL